MNEMLEDMNSQPSASEGFSAATFYKMGQKYGVTCSEIMTNFLGKNRALSRGKYPAVAPDAPLETSRKPKATPTPKPLKAAAKKVTKKTAAKTEKQVTKKTAAKTKVKTEEIADTQDEDFLNEQSDDFLNGAPADGVVYIATPEEIASQD
jgi:hypothetical protein